MARFVRSLPLAIAATLLFAACVNLTSPLQRHNDAGAKDGSASADLANLGSGGSAGHDGAIGGAGGSAAVGGAATGGIGGQAPTGGTGGSLPIGGTGGLAPTGGTGGSATGGSAGNVALDAGVVADATSSETGGIDVPLAADTNLPVDRGTGGGGTGDAMTGGTGGTATGGATTGGTGGTATGGAGGTTAVDAGTKADAISLGDSGIDLPFSTDSSLPPDLGIGHFDVAETAGLDVAETGSFDVPGTGGADGNETGESGTDGASPPRIISIDFVGGVSGDAGIAATVVMAASESAGVKPATNWNGAQGSAGTLSSLKLADGTTSSASVTWNAAGTWSLYLTDPSPGDARMMNGYLDPMAPASPATVTVSGLASPMSSGYDVYVYCYGDIYLVETRTFQYTIGSTTQIVSETGISVHAFPGFTLASDGGTGNYVVFRNVTGASFTLTATPGTPGTSTGLQRAPVNGIQIVYPAGS